MLADIGSSADDPNVIDVGYYNPLAYAPLRQSYWKKELRQAGKPRYTQAQIEGFVAAAETSSFVFPAWAGVDEVLLHSPVHGDLGQALKEYAVLRLNLASSLLFMDTAVNLPELPNAKSIEAVVGEIEGVLAYGRMPEPPKDEYQRVRKLAEAVNSGKGLGSGLTGVFSLAQATYRGASVVSKLRPGGDNVDLGMDEPVRLQNWSPGTLDTTAHPVLLDVKVRVRVKVFMDGGVLEVVRVSDGRILGTIVPPVWNKDINATYTLAVSPMSLVSELVSTEIQLFTRDNVPGGKPARVRIDSAELVFKY
jgi:hypothetical protein